MVTKRRISLICSESQTITKQTQIILKIEVNGTSLFWFFFEDYGWF